jgi:NAD(P) transhydrogenase subunit alpha
MISPLVVLLVIFVLSAVIGYFVVWGVTPALHTPLMAVTNAISGIVLLAAILVVGPHIVEGATPEVTHLQWGAKLIGFVAVVLCSINIFGGFAITRRMLAMFKSKQPAGKGE